MTLPGCSRCGGDTTTNNTHSDISSTQQELSHQQQTWSSCVAVAVACGARLSRLDPPAAALLRRRLVLWSGRQLYALSATAAAAASPADPTTLRLQVLMPRAGLLATPLYTKRLCHVPLAEALLKPGCMATGQVSCCVVWCCALWPGILGANTVPATRNQLVSAVSGWQGSGVDLAA